MSDIEPLYQCERCKEDYPEGSCYPLSQLGHAGTKDGPILCDYCMDDYRIENDGGGDPSSWYAVRDPREDRIVDLEGRVQELELAIRWAMGESPEGAPEFPVREPGQGPYYWRPMLRELSGVQYTPPEDSSDE